MLFRNNISVHHKDCGLQTLSRLLHCFNEALYMQRGAKPSTARSELTKINTAPRCPPAVCTSDGAE